MDYGFDFGSLECTSSCAIDFSHCYRFGWSRMDSGTGEDLHGVWAAASDAVFAVGDRGTVLRFDGETWQPVAVPTDADLLDVWAADASHVFVVGAEGTLLSSHGSDSNGWRVWDSDTSEDLVAVSGLDANRVAVMGSEGTLLRFDGTGWERLPASGLGNGTAVAYCRDGSIRGAFVVRSSDGWNTANIARFQNGSWSVEAQLDGEVFDFWGPDCEDAFAVGSWAAVWRRRDGRWEQITDMATVEATDLHGVWGADSDHVFSVGRLGGAAYFDGHIWADLDTDHVVLLEDVAGLAKDRVFAVGEAGTILEFGGQGWTTLSVYSYGFLWSLAGNSPDAVWAFGDQGVVLRWDGTSWIPVSGPSREFWSSASACGTDCFYALTWSGRLWKFEAGQWEDLSEAYGLGPIAEVWAAGPDRAYVVHDTRTWVSVLDRGSLTNVDPLPSSAYAIAGSASGSVFVAGKDGLLARLEGATWRLLDTGSFADLYTLAVRSDTEIYAGGHGILLQCNGTICSPYGSFVEPDDYVQNLSIDSDGRLLVVVDSYHVYLCPAGSGSCSSGLFAAVLPEYGVYGALVVGRGHVFLSGPDHFLAHYDPGTNSWLVRQEALTRAGTTAYGMAATAAGGRLVVTGSIIPSGLYLYDGVRWTPTYGPATSVFHGLWSDGETVYVVGTEGTIQVFSGNRWTLLNSGTQADLYGVFGLDESRVAAVGAHGTFLLYDGVTWTDAQAPTDQDLKGVWIAQDGTVFAVGTDGTFLAYREDAWTNLSPGGPGTLWSVWGTDSANVFAVGDRGAIYHFDGEQVLAQDSSSVDDLLAIWGRRWNEIYAAGRGGTMVAYDGARWFRMESGVANELSVLWGDEHFLYAAGTIHRLSCTDGYYLRRLLRLDAP